MSPCPVSLVQAIALCACAWGLTLVGDLIGAGWREMIEAPSVGLKASRDDGRGRSRSET